uniref:Unkown protein n=1 Tax=Riptortus pedestris TaxID=329032 RepID=R4WDZ8_RIPPE|nr:unkown protein [Riptortus pedestris]
MLENGLFGGEISIKVEPNYDYETQDEEKKTEERFGFVDNAVLFSPENMECIIKTEPQPFRTG